MQTRSGTEMKQMMEELYGKFRNAKSTRGNPIFKAGMRDELLSLAGHIDDGCFLDKEGFR